MNRKPISSIVTADRIFFGFPYKLTLSRVLFLIEWKSCRFEYKDNLHGLLKSIEDESIWEVKFNEFSKHSLSIQRAKFPWNLGLLQMPTDLLLQLNSPPPYFYCEIFTVNSEVQSWKPTNFVNCFIFCLYSCVALINSMKDLPLW